MEDNTYTGYILGLWTHIIETAEVYRISVMEAGDDNDVDSTIQYKYISQLTRLWLELEPKMAGIKSNEDAHKELESDFMSFRAAYYDPNYLIVHSDQIFKLEETLRTVIEKLGITKFYTDKF